MIRSRTSYLILGLLAESPRTGYEIRKITQLRYRFFWSESYGQIYPALRELESEGCILAVAQGPRGKRVYSITEAGLALFLRWIGEPAAEETARFEAILKVSFGWAMKPEALETLLRDFASRQERNLEQLRAFKIELESIPDHAGNHDIALMTIDLGLATYQAWKEWSDRALAASAERGRIQAGENGEKPVVGQPDAARIPGAGESADTKSDTAEETEDE